MLSIFINLLLVIHVGVSLLIILLVLMQRPKNEGLGAAFGGGMTDNLFGAQTTNVLQNFTRWLAGIFFSLTLLLSILYAKQASFDAQSDIQRKLLSAPVPSASSQTVPGTGKAKTKEEVMEEIQKALKTPKADGADKTKTKEEITSEIMNALKTQQAAPAASAAPADATKKDAK